MKMKNKRVAQVQSKQKHIAALAEAKAKRRAEPSRYWKEQFLLNLKSQQYLLFVKDKIQRLLTLDNLNLVLQQ